MNLEQAVAISRRPRGYTKAEVDAAILLLGRVHRARLSVPPCMRPGPPMDERRMALLDFMQQVGRPIAVGDIAERTGATYNQIKSIVRTLAKRGWVEQVSSRPNLWQVAR